MSQELSHSSKRTAGGLLASLLAGYLLWPNHHCHAVAWCIGLAGLLWQVGWRGFRQAVPWPLWIPLLLGLMLWHLLRGCVGADPAVLAESFWRDVTGAGILATVLVFCCWLGRVMSWRTVLSYGGWGMLLAGLSSSVYSLVVVYGTAGQSGAKCINMLVYGGLNPVCSGMLWAVAAVWVLLEAVVRPGRSSWLWLLAAGWLMMMSHLTLARGALLALVAGCAVLAVFSSWSVRWRVALCLSASFSVFLLVAPWLNELGVQRILAEQQQAVTVAMNPVAAPISPPAPPPALAAAGIAEGEGLVSAQPLKRLIQRGDTGRFDIYRFAGSSLKTLPQWLFGHGQWCEVKLWQQQRSWLAPHLHSIYLDALVHSGLLVLLGLLICVFHGSLRCWQQARAQGQAAWLALLAMGLAGLLVDGHSAFNWLSLPRFEALMLWVPMALSAGSYAKHE
jgi:O-Antigen ligase